MVAKAPTLVWQKPEVNQPPYRQNVLVYRSEFYTRPDGIVIEDRRLGVDRYDLDQYTGLSGEKWAFRAGVGNTYPFYCRLPPHPQWRADKLPNTPEQIIVVFLVKGTHQGEFLSKIINCGSKAQPNYRRMVFLGKGFNDGWSSLSKPEKILRCWLPVPEPPLDS